MEKAKMSEENQKMRYKFEKIAKNCPTWANLEPQDQKTWATDGIREPLSLLRKERNPTVTYSNPFK